MSEMLINRHFICNKRQAILTTITIHDKNCILSVLYDNLIPAYNQNDFSPEKMQTQTNRDNLKSRIYHHSFPYFHRIYLEGVEIACHSHQFLPATDEELSHYRELGIDFSKFTYTGHMRFKFSKSRLPEGIDWALTPIKLKTKNISPIFQYIGMPFTLKLDGDLPDVRYSFYDELNQRKRYFYINSFKRQDLGKNFDDSMKIENEYTRSLTDEQKAEQRAMYITSMRGNLPPDSDAADLIYESEDEIQLDFLSKAWLDEIYAPQDSFISSFMIRDYMESTPHGCSLRNSTISPIPKGFIGDVELELSCCYVEVDDELMVV